MNNNEVRSIPLPQSQPQPQTGVLPLSTASILRSEWTFVIATIVAILFLTSLPFLYAYLTAPPDKQFMGIMVNVPDHAQYFSWMRELTESNLSANKLTPEPNAPIFFNLMWWALGKMGAALGVGYPVMYQVMRVAGAVLFLLLAYRVCAWFLKDTLQRRVAFLIIALGGGFGWVLILLKYTLTNGELINPLDVFVAEPNTFYSILAFPHFVAAALYILCFDLVLRGQAKGQLRYAVYAGLWALFMGWQHAYDLFIVYGVLGAYAMLLFARDRKLPWYVIKATVIVGLISFWPGLYSFLITSLDPVWKAVLAQFDNAGVFTPPVYRLPVLLGIPFLLAVFTVAADFVTMLRAKRAAGAPVLPEPARPSDNDLFLKGWFLVSFVLVYLPVDFQIHMLNGWQVPIAILATRAVFDYIAPFIRRRSASVNSNANLRGRRLDVMLGALIVLLVIPTNIYLWAWRFVDLRRHDYPYYLHKEELAAMRWLEANAKGDDVVLSSLTTGQYVPMLTGAHAYLGHWAQTLDFFGKTQAVERFFAADTAEPERQAILSAHDVDYVFVGPAERTLGGFDPGQSGLYEPVYTSPLVSVYRPADNP
jgi:hypothetical protein